MTRFIRAGTVLGLLWAAGPVGAIEVMPESIFVHGRPGAQVIHRVDLFNDSSFSAQVSLQAEEAWIKVRTKNLTLPPKKRRTVKISFQVPRGKRGDLMGTINVKSVVPDGVTVEHRVSRAVVLRVDGPGESQAALKTAGRKEKDGWALETVLRNTGDYMIRPKWVASWGTPGKPGTSVILEGPGEVLPPGKEGRATLHLGGSPEKNGIKMLTLCAYFQNADGEVKNACDSIPLAR